MTDLLIVTEPAGVVRDNSQHLRQYAVRCHYVVPTDIFDVQELIFGRHLLPRDDLNPVFLPAFHRFVDIVHVFLILSRVDHVRDKTGMTAVKVILAAKQHCRHIK